MNVWRKMQYGSKLEFCSVHSCNGELRRRPGFQRSHGLQLQVPKVHQYFDKVHCEEGDCSVVAVARHATRSMGLKLHQAHPSTMWLFISSLLHNHYHTENVLHWY